eukprot:COSAG02_NODE_3603_length_6494_cov_1.936826_2_plen_88_part_00
MRCTKRCKQTLLLGGRARENVAPSATTKGLMPDNIMRRLFFSFPFGRLVGRRVAFNLLDRLLNCTFRSAMSLLCSTILSSCVPVAQV